jgi:hypothetical protein
LDQPLSIAESCRQSEFLSTTINFTAKNHHLSRVEFVPVPAAERELLVFHPVKQRLTGTGCGLPGLLSVYSTRGGIAPNIHF